MMQVANVLFGSIFYFTGRYQAGRIDLAPINLGCSRRAGAQGELASRELLHNVSWLRWRLEDEAKGSGKAHAALRHRLERPKQRVKKSHMCEHLTDLLR